MSKSNIDEGFNIFLKLNKSERKIIKEEIMNAKIGKLPDNLARSVSNKTSISFDDSNRIFNSFASIVLTSEFIGENRFSKILNELEEDLNSKDISNFINEILKEPINFTISLKATNLAFNRARIIRETRIITDIRPIFTADPKSDLLGSMIVHNLKIEFIEGDERKEYYFAIDSADLKKMEIQFKRAMDKEDELKKIFASTGLNLIELN